MSSDGVIERGEVFDRLVKIERDGAYATLLSDAGGSPSTIEHVSGVTRMRRLLDFWIQELRGNKRSRALDPGAQILLRMGLYELRYMHTPAYAVVNETVSLARQRTNNGVARLTNAILREAERKGDALPFPANPEQKYSHPDFLVHRWKRLFGKRRMIRLLEWNNTRPVFTLMVNGDIMPRDAFEEKLTELGVAFERCRWVTDAWNVQHLAPLVAADLLGSVCRVQDEAAALVVDVLDPQPGELVIDACAAPGGKTFRAVEKMKNEGKLIAVDRHKGRLRLLAQMASQGNYHIVKTRVVDFAEWTGEKADRVLLDVPCSGTGVLSKRPDLRWRSNRERFTELLELQARLLDATSRAVKPGGILVYSTCSLEPEENESAVEAFVARNPDFDVEALPETLPAELVREDGFYFSFPPDSGMDGAFAARLRRKS